MLARTMIYLDAEDHQRLRREAHSLGISLAELLRRLVRGYLQQGGNLPAPNSDALQAIVALGSSGIEDISDHHDRYIGEALANEHSR